MFSTDKDAPNGRVVFIGKAGMGRKKHGFDLYMFLTGDGADAKGRFHAGILQQSNEWLEYCHDYIQELFPTDEPSMFVRYAPTVTIEEAYNWSQNVFVQENMKKAVDRMIEFYSSDDRFEKYWWVEKFNHNYRRISRILRSLRMFHLDDEADKFYEFVTKIADENPKLIDQKAKDFWSKNNEKIEIIDCDNSGNITSFIPSPKGNGVSG